MKTATLELRNLLPNQRQEGIAHCGVCGKPHASLTKAAKELPIHKQAIAEKWAEHFRTLTKALGANTMMDFVSRQKWNAQLEHFRDKLTEAREEHDAMPEAEVKLSDKAKLVETLGKTLALMGVKMDSASPVDMALKLHEKLVNLMAIRADIEANVQASNTEGPFIEHPLVETIEIHSQR